MAMMINSSCPEDIIIEILLNLPVKSLSRFICTCKSWYALIQGNNTFIQKHLHFNPEHHLILYHLGGGQRFKLLNSNDTTEISVDPNLCHAIKDFNINVHGHCNGILCLYHSSYGKGILWNPANRETRPLPLFPHDYKKQRYWYGLRLGYDERINDYKVVVFSRLADFYYINDNVDDEYRVDIYSMGNDSWKRFKGNVPFYISYYDHFNLRCLDGVFYWIEINIKGGSSRLLSFDIGNEVFEEIILPGSLAGMTQYHAALGKHNNHIAMIYNYAGNSTERRFEIWVLSSKTCWNKILSFGPFTHINLITLGFSEHDNKFLLCGLDVGNVEFNKFIVYDHQSQQFNDLGRFGVFMRALPYKESLVSVKRMPHDFSQVFNIADLFV